MSIIHQKRRFEFLPVIVVGTIVGNGLLWYGLSRGANEVAATPESPELVVERVTVEKPKPTEPKKVVVRQVPIPKPTPKPPTPTPPPKEVRHEEKTRPAPAPAPEESHNHVLTSKPAPHAPPSNFHALAGGQAKVGIPTSSQDSGNAPKGPDKPQPTAPVAPPPAPPAPPAPPSAPAKTEAPVAPPPPPPPKKEEAPPPPPPPPKPKGPTQNAVPSHQVNPEIPESFKSQTFKSFVRVKVSISSDGSFEVTLRTSSGNGDIDKLVLDALNKWKWKPALKDGEAVDSVQLFKFDFSVE